MATPDIPVAAFGATAPRRGASCPRWARAVAGMLHRPPHRGDAVEEGSPDRGPRPSGSGGSPAPDSWPSFAPTTQIGPGVAPRLGTGTAPLNALRRPVLPLPGGMAGLDPAAGTPDAAPLPVSKAHSTGPVIKAGALLDRLLDAVMAGGAPARWT